MAEYKLPTFANCDVLIQLVRECNLTIGACLDVAKMNENAEQAKKLLTQECPICCGDYMRNEVSILTLYTVLCYKHLLIWIEISYMQSKCDPKQFTNKMAWRKLSFL